LGGGEKFVREEREKLNFRKEVPQSAHKRKARE